MSLVPNQPLREAFECSEMSAVELAKLLGYSEANSTPVLRVLGLRRNTPYDGGAFRAVVHETTALKYAEALGLDPVDIGL